MASNLTSVECASSILGRPYMFGKPWAIPGYIEAENYDYGGHGVSDHSMMQSWGVALTLLYVKLYFGGGGLRIRAKVVSFLKQLHCLQ